MDPPADVVCFKAQVPPLVGGGGVSLKTLLSL